MTTIILIISGILIGAGVTVFWRDVSRNKRRAFVSDRDHRADAGADVEVVISRPAAKADTSGGGATEKDLDGETDTGTGAPAKGREDATAIEAEWRLLQPAIEAGVRNLNLILAAADASLGASGDTTWSFKNRGFGAYRRLLINNESVAWLRLEIAADGHLHASLKAHKEEAAELNNTAHAVAAQMTAARMSDLLSQCLKPLAGYVARTGAPKEPADPLVAASRRDWEEIDGLVTAALKATNGALGQAGGKLVALGPAAWEVEAQHHRMALAVEVHGSDVARMHIERLARELEVAVGVRDPQLITLGRRRRIPVDGLTIHALAELIASCAWPAIARFRETRRLA
jgi:hypothetical protein